MNIGIGEGLLKVILDTNILVSAFVFGGKPEIILRLCIEKQINAITSPALIVEFVEVLIKKFKASTAKIIAVENQIKESFDLVYPTKVVDAVRDEPDNRILEAAIEGECNYIISGDKDLLDLGSFRGIKIVTTDEFLEIFNKN